MKHGHYVTRIKKRPAKSKYQHAARPARPGHRKQIAPTVLKWESQEIQTHKKGKTWHILAGIFVALVIAYAAYDGAWTFVLALAVSIAAYYYFIYREKPRMLDIAITANEIKINNSEYKYDQIKFFWIIDKPEIKTLNIRLKRHFMPDITVFLGDQGAQKVRDALKNKIAEAEKNEGMTNSLIRLLKI